MNIDTWLNRAEKIFKTDIRYILRGGFWLAIGQFFSSASVFVVAVVLANLLSKDTYGLYKYILSIFSLLLIPTLTGMDTAVTQAISRGHDGVFKPAFWTKTLWGTLGLLGSIGFAIYYFIHGNTSLGWCFAIISVFIPFIESLDMYNAVLQGRQKFREFTAYNSLTQILSAACSIGAAWIFHSLISLVLAYVISNTLLNLLFLLLTLRRNTLNTTTSNETLTFGKHLSVMDMFSTAAAQVDKILVFHYLGAAELAVYTLAIAPPEQLKGLLKNIQYLAMPRFAQRSKEEIQKTLGARLFKFSLIIMLGIIVYIIFTPFVFNTFFPKYTEAIFYSQLISISIIGAVLNMIPVAFLQSQGAQRELYRYNVLSNIATIVIIFPGVYFWGLIGAIIARIIIRFFIFGLSYYYASKL